MFKISYIVDDKRLPEMIRATFDHVTDLKVTPMDVAVAMPIDKPRSSQKVKLLPAPKKAKEASIGPRNFMQELGWDKGFKFESGEIAKRCPSIGIKTSSRFWVIIHELKHKRIKKVGYGRYVVL